MQFDAPSLRARVRAAANNLRSAHSRRIEFRRTVAELSAMTDRELNDLGIARADIHTVASRAVGS